MSISHSRRVPFKSVAYQAHAGPAFEQSEVSLVLQQLRGSKPWARATCFSFAFRIGADDGSGEPETAEPLEHCEDDGDAGCGAKLLYLLGYRIDVVYVDSAHEIGETLIELFMYWQLLRPGGVLTGDDWLEFPAVKHDVSLFALCVNQSLHLLKDDDSERTNTWMLVKK